MSGAAITLTLEAKSYWLHAHGEGGGADFDLVMDRDDNGLPLLRGKHVAGLLRLALYRAVEWAWFGSDALADKIPDLLMGSHSEPGCLDIRSARVPEPLRACFIGEARQSLRYACFRRMASTAIDPIRSTAEDKTLRTIEAAVPLPLSFQVAFAPDDRRFWAQGDQQELAKIETAATNWKHWLECAWPALDEIGARRTRGFGRLGHSPFPSTPSGASQ